MSITTSKRMMTYSNCLFCPRILIYKENKARFPIYRKLNLSWRLFLIGKMFDSGFSFDQLTVSVLIPVRFAQYIASPLTLQFAQRCYTTTFLLLGTKGKVSFFLNNLQEQSLF